MTQSEILLLKNTLVKKFLLLFTSKALSCEQSSYLVVLAGMGHPEYSSSPCSTKTGFHYLFFFFTAEFWSAVSRALSLDAPTVLSVLPCMQTQCLFSKPSVSCHCLCLLASTGPKRAELLSLALPLNAQTVH
jgi:hypothetical protein